jgi:hypothetical protein
MYTKDDPVTWEIHVPSARESGGLSAREDRSWRLEGRGSRRAAYE